MRRDGFTLTELLVVIGIIVILLAIAIPAADTLINSGKLERSLTVIGASVPAARTHSGNGGAFPIGQYNGSAALFTSDRTIRLIQNAYYDADGSPIDDGSDSLASQGLDGYRTIAESDQPELPAGVGVVAIVRGLPNGDDDIALLPPPFAVRFNAEGQLSPTHVDPETGKEDRFVYYDSDKNGRINTDADRHNVSADEIEKIEAVVGLVVFERDAFEGAGHDMSDAELSTSAHQWVMDNGEAVFFGRYSGNLMRQN